MTAFFITCFPKNPVYNKSQLSQKGNDIFSYTFLLIIKLNELIFPLFRCEQSMKKKRLGSPHFSPSYPKFYPNVSPRVEHWERTGAVLSYGLFSAFPFPFLSCYSPIMQTYSTQQTIHSLPQISQNGSFKYFIIYYDFIYKYRNLFRYMDNSSILCFNVDFLSPLFINIRVFIFLKRQFI